MIWVLEILRKNSWLMLSIHSSFCISRLKISINNIQLIRYLYTSSFFLLSIILLLRIFIKFFLRLNLSIWTCQSWLIFNFLFRFYLFLTIINKCFFDSFWYFNRLKLSLLNINFIKIVYEILSRFIIRLKP